MIASDPFVSYRLLLIEDSPREGPRLKEELEANHWQVTLVKDPDQAESALLFAERQNTPWNAIAVDLGLPPYREEPEKSGLPLIQRIRERHPTVPIMAYTTFSPRHFNVEKVLHDLLILRVSLVFIKFLTDIDAFPRLLELVRMGYLILSPDVVGQLSYAIPSAPDPLEAEHWELLRHLSQGQTYEEIAKDLFIAKATVTNWLDKIRERLSNQYFQGQEIDNEDLIRWYNMHKVRYCRD